MTSGTVVSSRHRIRKHLPGVHSASSTGVASFSAGEQTDSL